MRDEMPAYVHERAFAVGIASAIAFLLPLLGREFAESIGVHPRLLAYAALAYVLVQSALTPAGAWFRPASQRLHLVVLGLLACLLALFPWWGPLWVPDEPMTVPDYAGHKLTRLLTLAIPTALLGVAARRFVGSRRFIDGFTWSTTVIAVIALGQLMVHRSTIRGSDLADLKEQAAFSTISVSVVFMFLQIVWCHRYVVERRHAWRPLVATAIALLGVFLLTQRTAMLLVIAFGLYVAFRDARGRARTIGLCICVIFGIWFAMDVVALSVDAKGVLAQFPAQVRRIEGLLNAEDNSSSVRFLMWEFGWNEGWRLPEGHGVGSFAKYFPANRYPHNVFIEALFELGIPGAILVAALLAITTSTIVRLFRATDATLIAFALLTTFSYALKAGDLSLTGNWLFWLYLAHGYFEAASPRQGAAARGDIADCFPHAPTPHGKS
jgi:O-antigen ligase